MSTLVIPLPQGGERQTTNRLVVHAMGEFVHGDDGTIRYCTDHLRHLGVSAHAIALPDGRRIDCVPPEKIAHHARAGGHNRRAVGIEVAVEGIHDYDSFRTAIDEPKWWTLKQWNAAAMWAVAMMRQFGPLEIVAHAEIDAQKHDPGAGFDLHAFRTDVAERLAATGG